MTPSSRREGSRLRQRVGPAVDRLRAAARDGAGSYVAAVGVRTGARAVWGLFLPAVLSVAMYGRYNVLVTLIAVAVQLAILGAPQTIVRNAGREIPTLGLLLHSVGIGVAVVGVAALSMPSTDRWFLAAVLAGVTCTAAYTLLSARAKALFAFPTSLRAEALGALTLVAGQLVLLGRYRQCGEACVTPALAVTIEIAAVTAALLVFVLARRTRLTSRDLSPRGTTALLGSVYSVGFLVVLDIVIWRRVEIYFLQRSPDGLAGVAVFGLALQMANMLLLIPTSIIETWQPRLAILFRTDREAFAAYFRSRQRLYLQCLALVCAAAVALPALALTFVFQKYRPWLWYVVALVAVRVVFSVAGFYSATLYATGRERSLYRPVLVGSVMALAANAALTLRFGLPGALAAQLLTQLALCGLTLRAFRTSDRTAALVSEPAREQAAA